MTGLPPVKRPDGRLYQPRKLLAEPVIDDDGELTAVLVLGTHDPAIAQPLADELARRDAGRGWRAVSPKPGWWRSGVVFGAQCWIHDEAKGRAAVMFEQLTEDGTEVPRG